MTKFTARALVSCVPICRSDLFEDVTGKESSQSVSRAWLVPGHVFLTLHNGCKLLTFDCKPVGHQHSIGSSTLDFPALKPAVLDIFISPLSPTTAYIVLQNGHVHSWQFSSAYQWTPVEEFDLCDDASTEITSICLHPKHHAFYWCERLSDKKTSYRICCKKLPSNVQQASMHSQTSDVVMQDCPAVCLLPVDTGLFIVPRHADKQTRVCVFWQPSVLQLVSVVTVIGDAVRNLHDMRSPLLYSDVVLSSISDLSKATCESGDLGVKQDCATGAVVLLHLDGTVRSFHVTNKDGKHSVDVKSVKIVMPENILQTTDPCDAWTVHRDIIAIATCSNTVRLYSATEGHVVHELELDVGTSLKSLVCVRSPAILFALITTSGVTVVQGGKKRKPNKQEILPSDKHFQTDALQVALLAQQREDNPGQQVSKELSALHEKWKTHQDHQPRSQLSDTVDAYLAEFWRLEEQASKLGTDQSCPAPSVYDANQMVREAVSRSRGMSAEAAMAELMWLSKKYPQQLMAVLLGDLDIAKEDLTAEDQALWQSTLGLDNADGQTHLQHNSVTFELVCRLLYQEQPDTLVAFVRNAQKVSEQAVGVSAFVRRKHTLQYYMRAMECLPEPNLSKNPRRAAFAKAQIILKGTTDHGPELALRFLLHHSLWSEAISLLRQLGPSAPHHSSLFFLLLQHLLQAQALSEHATQVFSLLPAWKSFLPVLKVMADSSGSQFAVSTSSLFYSGSPDIPLSALQPYLMSLLTDDKKQT